jgi:uncharacterized phage-associated protein
MLIFRNREKLINIVVYFASNTRHCSKIKLFKLLYLLDFAHFRETGRSVTGLDYHAWKTGPAPLALMQEWDDLGSDMANAINIVPGKAIDTTWECVVSKVAFDNSLFTRRELRLISELSTNFGEELTKPLIGLTHEERRPWDNIWDGGRGDGDRIPYTLAFLDSDSTRDAILKSAREYEGIRATAPRDH